MRRPRLSPSLVVLALSVAVLTGGAVLSVVPAGEPSPPPAANPGAAANPVAEDQEFAKLFTNGVAYMREGRHHEAIIVFEAALRRQPGVPEVLVNLGYLHLARKDFKSAEAAFQGAIGLRPGQVNAYWGLALTLEGRGDLEAALGAMKTFQHLEPESSPFRRKADAAVWEWEEQLRLKREGKMLEIPPGSVSAVDKQPVTTPEQLRRDYVPPEGPKP